MRQRTVLIVLGCTCLLAGISVVRGLESKPELASIHHGCFDVIVHSEYEAGGGASFGQFGSSNLNVEALTYTVLLDKCSGKTWLLLNSKGEATKKAWFPIRRVPQ